MQKRILTLLFICLTSLAWSQQTQEELEQKKAKIQQEILEKERMLQDVRSKEKSVVKLLSLQKEKIGLKEKLINTTTKQTKLLSNDMYINQVQINKIDAVDTTYVDFDVAPNSTYTYGISTGDAVGGDWKREEEE